MPYITQKDRALLAEKDGYPSSAGELNYCITMLIKTYMRVNGKSYQTINDIVGALVGIKDEFYRRIAAPYEDEKIRENGDVY